MKHQEAEIKIKELLDEEFLVKLTEIARLYGWNGDYVEIGSFVEALWVKKSLAVPELEPYDLEEN